MPSAVRVVAQTDGCMHGSYKNTTCTSEVYTHACMHGVLFCSTRSISSVKFNRNLKRTEYCFKRNKCITMDRTCTYKDLAGYISIEMLTWQTSCQMSRHVRACTSVHARLSSFVLVAEINIQ